MTILCNRRTSLKSTSNKHRRLETQHRECEKRIRRLEDQLQEERRKLQELEWELINLFPKDMEGDS